MAVIYYGVAGEGRGHAARSQTIIENLRTRHRLVVLTFGHSLETLSALYAYSDVKVQAIAGLELAYLGGRVSQVKTLFESLPVVFRRKILCQQIVEQLRSDRAALVISDFEPLSARAADIAGIPWVSIDHQRMLNFCDLSRLPLRLRLQAWLSERVLSALYSKPKHAIVSGFHLPPLRKGVKGVSTAGVLLRKDVLVARTTNSPLIVAYLRRWCPAHILAALRGLRQPVHIYGLGEQKPQSNLSFKVVTSQSFIADLAACQALITTAGNQLIGEAHYLGKPVLAFAEPGNFEQEINSLLLAEKGGGESIAAGDITAQHLRGFIERSAALAAEIDPRQEGGNTAIFKWLDDFLQVPRHAC